MVWMGFGSPGPVEAGSTWGAGRRRRLGVCVSPGVVSCRYYGTEQARRT